jgi:hypothetical protein
MLIHKYIERGHTWIREGTSYLCYKCGNLIQPRWRSKGYSGEFEPLEIAVLKVEDCDTEKILQIMGS